MHNVIDSNSIIIDTNNSNSRNINRKINCVLCFPKVELTCINPEENRYRCPRCKNDYQLGFRDIVPQEEELESSHEEDEEDSVGLLVAEDEISKEDKDPSKSDIAVPKYMQDSTTTTVTYYREN